MTHDARLEIRMPQEEKEALQAVAENLDVSMSDLIRNGMSSALDLIESVIDADKERTQQLFRALMKEKISRLVAEKKQTMKRELRIPKGFGKGESE